MTMACRTNTFMLLCVQEIGQGQFGKVYLSIQSIGNKDVPRAVKLVTGEADETHDVRPLILMRASVLFLGVHGEACVRGRRLCRYQQPNYPHALH